MQTDSGLLVPDHISDGIGIKGLVHVLLLTPDLGGKLAIKDEEWIHNLVTDVGDEYYSERAAGISSPPDQVTGMQLGTGTTAAAKNGAGAAIVTYISGSNNAIDGGYPTSDGSGLITWRTTWGAGDSTNAAITEAAIINQSIATNSGAAAAATISRTVFTAKDKQAADTLVITWTHTLTGA